MALLPITYAPHPIFKQIAKPVTTVDARIKQLVADMFDTLYAEEAVGLGANMVGSLERIAIVDTREDGNLTPLTFINPEVIWQSEEQQTYTESSLSFPYISAEISRPKAIRLRYLDENGNAQEMEAEGFLSTVIQHEIDYLNGVVYLDYLSKMKRDMLLKKMQKQLKLNPPHVHGPNCSHHHH